MTADTNTPRLTEAALAAQSAHRNEPGWLRQTRLDAWAAYTAIPAPTQREEEWRRTDTKWVRWADLDLPSNGALASPPAVTVATGALEPAVTLVHSQGKTSVAQISDEARRSGVLATSLATAASDHADRIQRHLAIPAAKGGDKFEALNAAVWSDGVLVYVPRGVELSAPVLIVVAAESGYAYPRTLVVTEAGASVRVVEWWTSPAQSGAVLVSGVVEIAAGDNSRIAYTHIQTLGTQARAVLMQRATLGRDVDIETTNVALGGAFHKASVDTRLVGQGSKAVMNAMYYLTGKQFVDHHTLQDHVGTDAASDLLFAGALDNSARSVYQGTIIVQPKAQRSNAYQKNLNLMLGDGARADSIPQLEIQADDVRCTHGATMTTVDANHLFYLKTRGLSDQDARLLVVDGYFEPVLGRIGDETVRDVVRNVVQDKVTRARGQRAVA